MRTFGVDVSHWEGSIDWSVAGQWIPFVYYKCTDGMYYIDAMFAANKKGCSAAGIPHAPFHYYQPSVDPILQATFFVKAAGSGYKRLIIDVEEKPVVADRLLQFLKSVEQLSGIKPAIYTSAGFWNEYVKPLPAWSHNYDLLVAHYTLSNTPLLPIGWTNFIIWQFTTSYYFPGCKEKADGNWFNGDLDHCRDWFGNYRPVDPPVYNRTRVRSLFADLRIRQSPSINSKILGNLDKGEIVEIEEMGGKDVWIKHDRGWSCVEKDGYHYMEVLK